MAKNEIIIKGARENNLKNVDLTVPRDEFVVFTGVSGSGKTSLAFDTIYAEGQRRYMESLSSYVRQFLGQMEKPNVDTIEGLSPAISIDQKTTNHNPRSTVGTVTEIYDYLRLLYARVGIPHCPKCGKEVKMQTIDQIVDIILELPESTKLQILAPVVRARKGKHIKILEDARKSGYVRARVNGSNHELTDEIDLEKNKKHTIEIVIDRIIIRDNIQKRLAEAIESAMNISEGLVTININGEEDRTFSSHFACDDCDISIPPIEPRSFSFNNPSGACERCGGLGNLMEFDETLVIDENLTINEGAIIAPGWSAVKQQDSMSRAVILEIAKLYDFDLDTKFKDYPEKIKKIILNNDKMDYITVSYISNGRKKTYPWEFDGILNSLQKRYKDTASSDARRSYEDYMSNKECPACKGKRLRPEILAVTVNNLNITEITDLPILEVHDIFNSYKLVEKDEMIASPILKEINSRVGFLVDVGLSYLTLSRGASTLSGGEAQRIRLATQIGSGLVGVVYILDEPSIGLHQRDNDRLLKTLFHLRDLGNTLIVVEHDHDTLLAADYVVDVGPYAGNNGGEVVFSGRVPELLKSDTITGNYLSGKTKIEVPKLRRKITKDKIVIKGCTQNNLKNINVSIPLGVLTCVTGVSGSGKSSLVNQILYKNLANTLNGAKGQVGKFKSMTGHENLDKIINIDQSPIGRTPRSNPATYTGVFDLIRDVFTTTEESKIRGYQKGRFSFNVKGGRCEACTGDGIIKIEMHFLPDVYVPCSECHGKRYNRETLEVKYKGKTISDVLEMTVEEALEFFENHPKIYTKLKTLNDVGLSYIKLGQPSTTLSGGESQRVKLSEELSKRSTGNTIYVLDEPTTGLHSYDVHKLVHILQNLTDGGNTVVVIEHNLDVIKTADYIIDIGPEGGDKGGEIVANGTPEEVSKVEKSYTGKYLKEMLN